MIRIIIAEDHELVRKSLKRLVEQEPGIQVEAEAADGAEAIRLVDQHNPDVLVCDLSLPKVHGFEVIHQVACATTTRVLVVSMYVMESCVLEAIHSGAKGYVAKDSAPNELILGIKHVAAGKPYLCQIVYKPELFRLIEASEKPHDMLSLLTKQERVVLALCATGLTSREMAEFMQISSRTIESHRASFMQKLKLQTQAEVVRFAIRKKLINA